MGVRETADEQEGGHEMALCGYGGEITAHISSRRAEVSCPFSHGVWSVTLGVASVNLCATLWAQSLLQDLRIADWHMMHVNNLWETQGGNAGGCSSTAMLSVSVYIRSCGDHQVRCACHPSKSKCSNCFVATLQAEIDQSLSLALTVCKWIRLNSHHALWPFKHKKS